MRCSDGDLSSVSKRDGRRLDCLAQLALRWRWRTSRQVLRLSRGTRRWLFCCQVIARRVCARFSWRGVN